MAFFLSKTHQTDSIISYSLQIKFKRFFLLKPVADLKRKKARDGLTNNILPNDSLLQHCLGCCKSHHLAFGFVPQTKP